MPWWLWAGAVWLALNVLVALGGLLRAYNRTRSERRHARRSATGTGWRHDGGG